MSFKWEKIINDKEGVDVVGKLPTEIKLTRHAKQRLEEKNYDKI